MLSLAGVVHRALQIKVDHLASLARRRGQRVLESVAEVHDPQTPIRELESNQELVGIILRRTQAPYGPRPMDDHGGEIIGRQAALEEVEDAHRRSLRIVPARWEFPARSGRVPRKRMVLLVRRWTHTILKLTLDS